MSRNLMNLYALFLRRKRKSSHQPNVVHVSNCDLTGSTRQSSERLDNSSPVPPLFVPDPGGGGGSDWNLHNFSGDYLREPGALAEFRKREHATRSTSLENVHRRSRYRSGGAEEELRSRSQARAKSVIDLSKQGSNRSTERLNLLEKTFPFSKSFENVVSDKTGHKSGHTGDNSDKHGGDSRGRRRGNKRWPSEPWLGPTLVGALAASATLLHSGFDEWARLEQVEREMWMMPVDTAATSNNTSVGFSRSRIPRGRKVCYLSRHCNCLTYFFCNKLTDHI